MMRVDTHLRQLTDALRQSLELCAADPTVEAVHDTRTGTRRIEAALEAALDAAGGTQARTPAMERMRWRRRCAHGSGC